MKLILFLTMAFSLGATSQNICEQVGVVKVGDKFSTTDKQTIQNEAEKDATRLGGNHYVIEYVKHTHPKLGASYSANIVVQRCVK